MNKWQDLIDLCSRIMKVPSGLIMQLHENQIEVFLKNNNQANPYRKGGMGQLGIGLYCEIVVMKKEFLLIPDARKNEVWKDNPDVELEKP